MTTHPWSFRAAGRTGTPASWSGAVGEDPWVLSARHLQDKFKHTQTLQRPASRCGQHDELVIRCDCIVLTHPYNIKHTFHPSRWVDRRHVCLICIYAFKQQVWASMSGHDNACLLVLLAFATYVAAAHELASWAITEQVLRSKVYVTLAVDRTSRGTHYNCVHSIMWTQLVL